MDLFFQFIFNILMLSGIIVIVSFLDKVSRQFTISLAILNMVIFILSTIFSNQEMSIGSGLGMFALFTLIRYRSEQLRMAELSYILVAVCMGILNAVYPGILTFFQIAILEISMLLILVILLKTLKADKSIYKIRYEKLDLLKPEKFILLKRDLQNRLGSEISSIEIESFNFHEQYANLKVTFTGNSFDANDNKIRILNEQLQKTHKELYSAS